RPGPRLTSTVAPRATRRTWRRSLPRSATCRSRPPRGAGGRLTELGLELGDAPGQGLDLRRRRARERDQFVLGELGQSGSFCSGVCGAFAKPLSPGEKEKVLLTLPGELRELWAPEPAKVRQIMTKEESWVGPELSLQDAAKKMRDLDTGCLPVGKDDRLIGMITDR